MPEIAAVILAAGEGKRLRRRQNEKQKVLVEIARKPMLGHVLDVVSAVGIKRSVVVVGYQSEHVEKYLKMWRRRLEIQTVKQEKLSGTADAVKQTEKIFAHYKGDVLVLYGDTPLLSEKTLRKLLERHGSQKNECTLLTTRLADPTSYGRIVYAGAGRSVAKIVEELDATPAEKEITEINVGVYCFKSESLFAALKEVRPNNRKGEYYLTDTIAILSKKGKTIRSVLSEDRDEVVGVNSQVDLDKARHAFERLKTGRPTLRSGTDG